MTETTTAAPTASHRVLADGWIIDAAGKNLLWASDVAEHEGTTWRDLLRIGSYGRHEDGAATARRLHIETCTVLAPDPALGDPAVALDPGADDDDCGADDGNHAGTWSREWSTVFLPPAAIPMLAFAVGSQLSPHMWADVQSKVNDVQLKRAEGQTEMLRQLAEAVEAENARDALA